LRLKQLLTSDPKESWLVVSMIDLSKIVFSRCLAAAGNLISGAWR
jgi:hypothetical protein